MRKTTSFLSQSKPDFKSGETLTFEACKGGYFSAKEEYGLKVVGKYAQSGTPTMDTPLPIQSVKANTKIVCGNQISVPCDLYETDIWFPASGTVERHTAIRELTGTEAYIAYSANPGVYYLVFSDAKIGQSLSKCTHFSNVNRAYNESIGRIGYYCDHPNNTRKYFKTDFATADDFKSWIAHKYVNNTPVTVIYQLAEPVIEQYEPQQLYALSGTVNVIQQPVELSGNLEATMLVKGR